MQIQSTRLGLNKEFKVKGELALEEVDSYFSELAACKALSVLSYDVCLINRGKFIALEADLSIDMELYCARCGEELARSFKPHVSLKLVDGSKVSSVEEVGLSEEELDTVTYLPPVIELGDILLESIYLELDEEDDLCRADCKGLCMHCGKNLNEGPCSCSD